MRCENCGGNPVHCKCPMPVNAVAVGAPVERDESTDHTPHLPQAVTAEPERPPFAPKDTAELLDNPGTFITVADCEKTVCHGIIPWIVTDTDGKRHYAKGLRRVEVKEETSARPSKFAPCIHGAAEELAAAILKAVNQCRKEGRESDPVPACKIIDRHIRPVLDAQHEVIEGLIRDRDGARRALAGNIEVTERQLKEAGAEIERLKVMLARAIPYVEACIIDLENEVDHEYDHTEAQRAIGRQIHEGNEFQNEIIALLPASPNLQPGTEADHGQSATA
jgi:hypothetical protein